VLDLFCGIGNFSLAAAALGCSVVGLEANDGAVQRARANASLNGLEDRCEFRSVDLYDPDSEVGEGYDYVVLDPPRSGAGAELGTWMKTLSPRRVAYVSCNPRSFAHDARVLADCGYGLRKVGIFDMFPHTAHVETLGIFESSW
jgi:23S rRNA (uracil1939-C5)-methyltransferase